MLFRNFISLIINQTKDKNDSYNDYNIGENGKIMTLPLYIAPFVLKDSQ